MFSGLQATYRHLQEHLSVYQQMVRDPRTPRLARWLLASAIGYLFLPFDLIPDFIPVIGHLDDLIVVPLLVVCAIRLIPAEVKAEYTSHLEKL